MKHRMVYIVISVMLTAILVGQAFWIEVQSQGIGRGSEFLVFMPVNDNNKYLKTDGYL